MTENKRFELTINEKGYASIIDWVESKKKNAYCIYNDLGVIPFASTEAICNKLNEQEKRIKELETENNQLKRKKERYKQLSEIRDENINNRILSLKDFINNCEDEKVKNILEDLFYSEVKEYDLAKENRKLKRRNEQLKKDRFICLDCKYCGHIEIGCLCEKQDHWEEFKSECNNFEKLKY